MAETYYAWNPVFDCITKETDAAGATIAEYTHEPKLYGGLISQHRSGASSFYHYDVVGTTRALTNSSQVTTDTAVYTAFGEKTASVGSTVNPFGFVGAFGYYVHSETNDADVRARNYKAHFARWLAVDPLSRILATLSLEFLNAYKIADNSPLSHIDPSGLLCIAVGRPGYDRCGRAQWKAQFVLDAADGLTTSSSADVGVPVGFVIQQVKTKYVVEACEGEIVSKTAVSSGECPKCEKFDKDAKELIYWEMWPINGRGNFYYKEGRTVRENAVIDLMATKGLDTRKTVGNFSWQGFAYFVKGAEPPDGWEKWKQGEMVCAGPVLYTRCDAPTGAPAFKAGAIGKSPGRDFKIEWDCCDCPVSDIETTPHPTPGAPPIPGKKYWNVWNECPGSKWW